MITYPTYQKLKEYVNQGHNFLPITIIKRIPEFNPILLLERLKNNSNYYFILESNKSSQYTYIGCNPLHIIKGENKKTTRVDRKGNEEISEGNPLEVLKKIMSLYSVPRIDGFSKFYGGAVGYLSYDMVRYFEELPDNTIDDIKIPVLYLTIFDKLWIYDHNSQQLSYIEYIYLNDIDLLDSLYESTIEGMKIIWEELIEQSKLENKYFGLNSCVIKEVTHSLIETSFSEQEYIKAVKKIQTYISQGDVYQVNLSIRQSKLLSTDGLEVYKHLRKINPSPYMGFINYPDLQIVSGSPELLLEVKNRTIQTRPIAGTRPRGKDAKEDEKLVFELLNNEKEIAEHIMLVDLERNDLGKVCKYGTVDVNQLMFVEKYSHVMHIVSNIVGELKNNYDIYDCIKAIFPGGTITGVPKIRTMEIIEELEPVKRGPYTGSMGWIGFNGDSELNILIRTLLVKDGIGHIQAGAGIVIDSIPKNEYIESLNKAKAIWQAVESSEKNN